MHKDEHKHGKHNNPFSEDNYNNEEQTDMDLTENENIDNSPNDNSDDSNTQNDEISKIKHDFENLNNQYVRLAADFDNYRKRQAQERESLLKYGMEEALKKVIDVLDNFDRAEKSINAVEDCDKLKETFEILHKQTIESLTKMGLEVIETQGQKFDPNFHEAVMQTQTDEYPEETIIKELQKGYKFADKVLRPALVDVAVQ